MAMERTLPLYPSGLLFHLWENNDISFQTRVLQKGEQVWTEFQALEPHHKQLVPIEHLAVERLCQST